MNPIKHSLSCSDLLDNRVFTYESIYEESSEEFDITIVKKGSLIEAAEYLIQAIASPWSCEECEKIITLRNNIEDQELLNRLFLFVHSIVTNDEYNAQLELIDLIKNTKGREILHSILDRRQFSVNGKDGQKLSLRELILNHNMKGVENTLSSCNKDETPKIQGKIFTTSSRRTRSIQASLDPLCSISTKNEKISKCFENALPSLLQESKGRVTIIYTYPLYKTDESLFNFLRTLLPKNERVVRKFLGDFAKHFFPHGVNQIIAAKGSYQLLLSDLKIDIPTLQIESLEKQLPLKNISELLPKEPLVTCWSDLSEEEIIEGLTHRDAFLLRSTDVASIGKWLNSQPNSQLIGTTRMVFDYTVTEIAYQIVSKTDDAVQRESEILKFVRIGRSLLKNKNFNGAMQVSMALNQPAVRRLWESNKATCSPCEKLIAQCTRFRDKGYDDYVNEKVLPYESSIYLSLQKTYADIKNEKIQFTTGLKKLALNIRLLKNGRLICSDLGIQAEKLRVIQFLSGFQAVTQEAIEEYSFLCFGIKRNFTRGIPKLLHKWNATDLVRFISNRTWAKAVLNQGIFTGNILIQKLEQNKHFMDNWPYDIRVGFANLYAQHVNSSLLLFDSESS